MVRNAWMICCLFLMAFHFSPLSNTENFTGDSPGTTTFAGPSSEDFRLTGDIAVDFNSGNGTTGDDEFAGTPDGSSVHNAVGTVALCELTKAFQVTEIDCWTSENGGSNYASGPVTFIGYLHGGGTVSYSTTVTPINNSTGYDQVSFSGTDLDGEDLTAIQFIIGGDLDYLAIDGIDYSITSALASFNSLPTASGVSIGGTLNKGQTLSGTYTYFDCDDAESGTTFQWYRSDDASGTNKAAISGATSQNYTLTPDDVDKYLTIEVTPSNASGTGLAHTSSYAGPILCGATIIDNDFEAFSSGATSYTDNSQSFSISGASAQIAVLSSAGWNGSSADDQFIDNDGEADNNDGGEVRITTTDGTDIIVQSFYVWSAEDNYTKSATANLTITGRRDGAQQFSFTKNSGFNTTGSSAGWTYIDMATEGSSDYSATKIDELILTNSGIYEYIAVDALEWGSLSYSSASMTTATISTFDESSATLGGEVTDDGCASVTERGIVYNTTGSPTTSDTKVTIGSGSGVFSQSVTGLSASTTYYVRSYAINSEGTSYGSQQSFTTSAAFPVEFLSFSGEYRDQATHLSWETASEFQNKGFRVMRLEGLNWKQVGFIGGKGTSQDVQAYQFSDPVSTRDASLYYQLAQEDLDGQLNYSSILEIAVAPGADQIRLMPNPVADQLRIESEARLLSIVMLDVQGRQVYEASLDGHQQNLDLSVLPKGIYFARVKLVNQKPIVKKLVIE